MKVVKSIQKDSDTLVAVDYETQGVDVYSISSLLKTKEPIVGIYYGENKYSVVEFSERDYYVLDLIDSVEVVHGERYNYSDKAHTIFYRIVDDNGLILANRFNSAINVCSIVGKLLDGLLESNLSSTHLPNKSGGAIRIKLIDNWQVLYTKLKVMGML